MKFLRLLLLVLPMLIVFSCTKLEEKFNGDLTADQISGGGNTNVAALLRGVYDAMRTPYQDQSRVWAAQEHTSQR